MLAARRHGQHAQPRDIADARQRLPPKPQSANAAQVFKLAQLGGGVALAEHGQVLALRSTAAHVEALRGPLRGQGVLSSTSDAVDQ